MHALIVVSHPLNDSLTYSIATSIAQGIAEFDPVNTAEIIDLTADGFNPVFSPSDIAAFMKTGPTPPDVVAQQSRIDKSDTLVLVFPVYWWSMPALMKGWIDRVFTNGWAYDDTGESKVIKMLSHLRVRLVALGGANQKTWDKRGYSDAFNAQIIQGIFDYCGAKVESSEILLFPELETAEAHLDIALQIGKKLFSE